MGNHLTIGQGIGEAAVWNPNPAIQNFTNILAQQKAQRDAEKQQLINQMGSIDTSKLRDPDKQDYYNKFQDWQQSAIDAQNAPQNSREKMMAQGLAAQKLNNLKSFIGASAQAAAEHKQIGNQLLQDSFRHQFKDDAVQKYIQSNNLPMSDPNFISDPNTLERQPNHEKEDDLSDKAQQAYLKQTPWSNPIQSQGVDRQGNKTGVVVHNERSVSPTDVAHYYLNRYDISPDFRKSLADRYPNIQDKASQIQQYMKDRDELDGWSEKTKPEFKANYAPDKFYAHYDYRLANPAGGAAPQTQPGGQTIPYKGFSNQQSAVHAPNYVPLSLPNKNFAGASGINLDTGQPEKGLNSSDEYSIVGAGDFPVVKKGIGYNNKIEGSLAQPDFVAKNPNDVEYKRMVHVREKALGGDAHDHLIPYENLPANVANQKDVRAALSSFNKTPVYGSQQPDNTSVLVKLPNGRTGHVPLKNYIQFKKENPGAQRIDQ